MAEYTELINALRHCSYEGIVKCNECKYSGKEWPFGCEEELMKDAADAIEDLEGFLAEAERDRDEYEERMRKEQERVIELQAEVERLQADVDAAYAH